MAHIIGSPSLRLSDSEVEATLRSLPEAAAHRWAGVKDGRHKPYFASAVAYERTCTRSHLTAWPVTGTSLEAFAHHLGSTMLPSSVDSNIQRVKTFCTASGLAYPPRSQRSGLRLVTRGQQRRAWRDLKRARPLLRARHLRRLDTSWGTAGHQRRGAFPPCCGSPTLVC